MRGISQNMTLEGYLGTYLTKYAKTVILYWSQELYNIGLPNIVAQTKAIYLKVSTQLCPIGRRIILSSREKKFL